MRNNLKREFEKKSWSEGECTPRSGRGSNLKNSARLRAALPGVFERYGIQSFLDAPCGDWFWMQHVDLSGVEYTGADISSDVIAQNNSKFGDPSRRFVVMDVTDDPMPNYDLVLCRDCLFHLKFWLRWAFLENFAASESRFLMTTMHHVAKNRRLDRNGDFRPFNPTAAPFSLDPPIEWIPETADELPPIRPETELGRKHRAVGLWTREQVVSALEQRDVRE
ncbi:MAG: class I SAM-dependent methyltransferase, partial [Boseongicola sp.]